MPTKTEKQQMSSNNLMIVLLLVSLLAVGGAVVVSKIMISSIALNTKVISAKNKAENNSKADLTAAPQLVSAYQALGSEATTLSDALPTTPDFPSLLVEIQNMSTGAGLEIKQISPAAAGAMPATTSLAGTSATAPATPQTSVYTMNYDGTYQSVQTMLTDLETSARPIRVTGLTISGSGSAISGEIDFETFYQAQAQLPFGEETIK